MVFVAGYRLAMIVAGAGALILSDYLSWKTVYLILGGMVALSSLATIRTGARRVQPHKSWSEAIAKPIGSSFRGEVRFADSLDSHDCRSV